MMTYHSRDKKRKQASKTFRYKSRRRRPPLLAATVLLLVACFIVLFTPVDEIVLRSMASTSNSVPLNQKTEALTPGSDFAFNFRDDFFVYGRQGNDFLFAFDPAAPKPTGFKVNAIAGDLYDQQLFPQLFKNPNLVAPGADTFVLGDWRVPYYIDGNFPGIKQFAFSVDFTPSSSPPLYPIPPGLPDTVQLYGSPSDYMVINNLKFPFQGTTLTANALLYVGIDPETGNKIPLGDLVSLFPALPQFGINTAPTLDLTSDRFHFVGTTPPAGPFQAQIKQIGTIGLDAAFSSASDPDGNIYVAGATSGSLAGPNKGSFDAFVAKYDNNGNQLWIQQLGTPKADTAFNIKTFVTEGKVYFYVVGTTTGDFGGKNEGYQDIWLAKFDGNGNMIWIQQNPQPLPGPDIDNSLKIATDKNGNLHQAGVTVSLTPPGSTFSVQDESWVAKYNLDGDLQWFKELRSANAPNTANFTETYGIDVANDGGVFSTGWTQSNFGGPPLGLYDVWFTKLDTSQGILKFVKKFGTENYEFPWGTKTDSQNNAYIAGFTKGNLGGPNAGPYQTTSDVFLAKYDSSGNQVWIRQFGTSGDDGLFLGGLTIDSSDNIFVTGYTDSNLGGPNAGSGPASYDAFVAKYDSSGNQLWIQQFGTPEIDYPANISVDPADNLFVTGYTTGSLGSINAGATDAWIAKLNGQTGNLQNFGNNALSVSSNKLTLNNETTGSSSPRVVDASQPLNSADQQMVDLLQSSIDLSPMQEMADAYKSLRAKLPSSASL